MTVVDEQQRYHQLLSVRQVSQQYGVGRTTVYEALTDKSLSGSVIGKRGTRIRRGDVEKWINSLKPYKPKKKP